MEVLGENQYKRFCLDDASSQSYAGRTSDYRETAGGRRGGVILNEYRRCEPAIMAFSNELVYEHVLELIGEDDHNKMFGSNLATFDIRGLKAAQHYNLVEIQACKEIIQLFIEQYGEAIGIIGKYERVMRVSSGKQILFGKDKIGEYLNDKISHNIIDTLRLHNERLNEMLAMANSSIHIISPWIGRNVVTDEILEIIRSKLKDGVKIHIIFVYKALKCSLEDIDERVCKDIPWCRETADQAIWSLLEILGYDLEYLPPSHVKLLLAHDRHLFIGSLNWLFNSGKTAQKKISCLVTNI